MLACSAVALATQHAGATAQLRISDGTVAGTVVITDDGPGDSANTTPGVITYSGPIGANWFLNVTTGSTYPNLGTAGTPMMDLGTLNLSSDAGVLTIDFSQDGFTAGGAANLAIGGNSVGTVTYQVWTDPGNNLFGKTTLVGQVGPLDATLTGGSFSGSATGTVAPLALYSITQEAVIQHNGSGKTGFDAALDITPPPCSCTVSFTSPVSITNCAGDTIPDMTAIESCGPGQSNTVPVTIVSSVTNGSCPKIVTRTGVATDDCGNLYTNSQTITINCKGSICGHIFADCDGSGDLSAGDVGLGKVTVTLLDNSNKVVTTTVTDTNGGYCFTNLAGGGYVVSVTPPAGYSQTAASTSYHWKDSYGRTCWQENDGYIHCTSSGTECWWDKYSNCHWKDNYGRDCWKDNWGYSHCQPCSYQSCNAQTNNNKISVSLTNCTSVTDVDFAYTGTKSSVSVCVSVPSYVRCGQSFTYTCTVTNTGNVCFTGGKVCHTLGNCGGWGGWNNCQYVYDDCPPLSPGQSCKFTHKCTVSSWNYGQYGCSSSVSCYSNKGGNCTGQSAGYTQCGW
jgi:hypothetical protein